jgi:hypothetical protein
MSAVPARPIKQRPRFRLLELAQPRLRLAARCSRFDARWERVATLSRVTVLGEGSRVPGHERLAALRPEARTQGWLVGPTILLAPVLVVLALRMPLINQLHYADAWFYSGYAWVPRHHFAEFGFNYFAVRFPAVLSIGAFENVFGVDVGYVLLRYLLAVATATSIYALVRRFSRPSIAVSTALLLYLSPFFSRMLLWDYSYFVLVSAGAAGIALWWWADGRHAAWTLLAGACLAAAVFAHGTFATVVLVLVLVELVAAIRTGDGALVSLTGRLALCVAASVGVFAIGWLSYLVLLGSVGPDDMLRPTIDFLRDNDRQVAPYVQPLDLWLLHSPRIWAPVVLSVALTAVLRGRLLGTDLPARIAQMCVCFTAFVWLFRFTMTSSFIETWWSYHVTVVVMAPAIGVLLHELATRRAHATRWAVAATAAAAATALIIRDLPWGVSAFYDSLNRDSALLLLGLAVALACALLLAARRPNLVGAALVGLVVCSGIMMYAPDVMDDRGGTGIFTEDGDQDWSGYSAGHEFVEFVRDHERRSDKVVLWYPSPSGYADIVWADLPQHGQTLQPLLASEPLDTLTDLGFARLVQPQVGSVLVMSADPRGLQSARTALDDRGFATSVESRGRFGHRLPYVLLDVESKP